MAQELHSGIVAPSGKWWVPAGPQEKLWVSIAFGWCLVLFHGYLLDHRIR